MPLDIFFGITGEIFSNSSEKNFVKIFWEIVEVTFSAKVQNLCHERLRFEV